jgi:hypothetical protein
MLTFEAQTINWSGTTSDRSKFAIIFTDSQGNDLKLTLPSIIASRAIDLMPATIAGAKGPVPLTFAKDARNWRVGSMDDKVVVVQFDNDPPYALAPQDAKRLSKALEDEADLVIRQLPPGRQ